MADQDNSKQSDDADRKSRKTVVGIVTSAKCAKTRRVEVVELRKHPKYGKYIRRRTVCHTHDEKNESQEGDTVEIMQARPMSKTKRWRFVRVVRRGGMQVADIRDDAALENKPAEAVASN